MHRFHPLLGLPLAALTTFSPAQEAPQKLWYEQPAKNWQLEALPIGNGNLGAMLFGDIGTEHIMFNEDSLWLGDENDTGSYQAFGDIFVHLHNGTKGPQWSTDTQSPSAEGIAAATDGNSATKWCVENKGAEVTAEVTYDGKAAPLTEYTLVSANDVPDRDPKDWEVQGSLDGKQWKTIDTRTNEPVWEKRQQSRSFKVANNTTYARYRIVFKAVHNNATHFQLGDIALNSDPKKTEAPKGYLRQLDIESAIHTVSYQHDGVTYQRESFSSNPAKVMVFHFKANKPGAHTGSIELRDAHEAQAVANGDTITVSGNLVGFKYDKKGRQSTPQYKIALDYEAQVKLLHQGGTVSVDGSKLVFKNCDTITLLVAADTNYLNQRDKGWKGPHPHEQLVKQLNAAAKTPLAQLRAQHIADYQKLSQRLKITLPENANSKLPTDKRLLAYQTDKSDLAFEAMMVQYARYLMISCSRPGSLPANLQGLWNPDNNPPWRCDYHSDVNVQMNYWFVDQNNISETFQPYADYQESVRAARRDATRKQFGEKIRGWATRSENGIFGGSSYLWVPGDAAWLAQNLWDHYAYTRNKEYLAKQAYPIFKELCEFWEDYLIEGPDGKLVSPKSVSPEHGPEVIGNSYEQQLIYDLFTNYIEASTDLGIDADYRKKVQDLRARLLGPKIGKWGQLQEWMEDIDDPKDQHRHLSHLIAVYPGRQISPLTTPELAKAAAVSLDARGDSGTGWSIGWKINLWARLFNGDRAHRILENALKPTTATTIVMNYGGGTYSNLLMAHPPFQIEANFGYASGFCEMLMQSHLGEIHLLPALPKAWPNGRITGLKARGNHIVDLEWKNGKLEKARITSPTGVKPKVRVEQDKEPLNASAKDARVIFVTEKN